MYDGEWRPPESGHQPYGSYPPGYQQAGSGGPAGPDRPNRTPLWIGIAVTVVVLVLAVALINIVRNRSDSNKAASSGTAQNGPLSPGPSTPNSPGSSGDGNGNGGGNNTPVPTVACPQIRDEDSHIAYSCIDNYLVQGEADTLLGLRISLDHEVEPGWVISEGSGTPKAIVTPPNNSLAFRQDPSATPSPNTSSSAVPSIGQQVTDEVHRRTNLSLQQAYGDNPGSKTLSDVDRKIGGVTAHVQLTEVTINSIYRASRELKAKTERLWTVGLPTKAGVSIFMMSIPDERTDLWPKADATINAITIF